MSNDASTKGPIKCVEYKGISNIIVYEYLLRADFVHMCIKKQTSSYLPLVSGHLVVLPASHPLSSQ